MNTVRFLSLLAVVSVIALPIATSSSWNSALSSQPDSSNGFALTGNSSTSSNAASSQAAIFSVAHVSSTIINQNVNFTLKWSAPSGIAGYIFSYDSGSGKFVNDSFVPVANLTTAWTNTTKGIPGTMGERIQWKYYVEDENGSWAKSYTYAFVAGGQPDGVSRAFLSLITDDAYDLLAYDGVNLANFGNFPQFVGTYGSYVGFHEVSWNPQGTMAIAIGYNNSAILYSGTTGSITILQTGASSDTNLNGVAWTPNGTSVVIAGSGPDVILAYSATTGNFTRISNPTGVMGLGPVAWNPVSNYAIITGSNGLIKYTDGGRLYQIPSASGISFAGIDFSPDGSMALLSAGGGSFYKYAGSSVSLVTTLSGITQLQQVKFSRDGLYALITAQSGSTSDLYKYDGLSVYPIKSASNHTANEISFSPTDSYATITTTGGGLLTLNYNSNSATLTTISANTRLRGVDFLPPAIVTSVTTTASSTSSSPLGFISIQSPEPHSVGTRISLSGKTLQNENGSAVPSQTIYIWINAQNQGSVASNSSGYWNFSFTPKSSGTYYASASQNADGGGLTSEQLQLTVLPMTTTTSRTTTTTITNSTLTNSTSVTSTNSSSTTQTTTTNSSIVTTSSNSSISTSTTSSSQSSIYTSSGNTSSSMTSTTTTSTSSATGNTTSTTSSTTSSSQSFTGTGSGTSSALFGFIPFLGSLPAPWGFVIFVLIVVTVVAVPLVVRKARKGANEGGGGGSHGWDW